MVNVHEEIETDTRVEDNDDESHHVIRPLVCDGVKEVSLTAKLPKEDN